MSEKLRYALIGCGRIAPNHIAAVLNNLDGLDFAAVCDPVPERMEAVLAPAPQALREKVRRYTDYRELLEKERPVLCAIATESGKHAQIGLAVIAAGSSLIIEKPLALSMRDARTLVEAAERAGVKLCACHQNRFNKSIQKIRTAVEEGRFGRMLHGTAHIRWNRERAYYEQAPWRGTWAQDGGALVTDSLGQQSSYVLQDDGTLYTEDDGVSMIFERGEAPAAQDTQEAAQPPEGVRTDAALADFNGEWTISYATAMGMQMEPETLGLDMNLSISDGSITIAGSGEQSVYTAALENGALVFSQSGLEMPLYLYEDGTLSMTMNMGGLNVEIVFERA